MGGPGSGRWSRWDTRTTLDEVTRLDVRWLQRYSYLDGWPRLVTWRRGEQPAGSIGVALQPGSPCAKSYRWPGRPVTTAVSGLGSGVRAVNGVSPCCVSTADGFYVGTATRCPMGRSRKRLRTATTGRSVRSGTAWAPVTT